MEVKPCTVKPEHVATWKEMQESNRFLCDECKKTDSKQNCHYLPLKPAMRGSFLLWLLPGLLAVGSFCAYSVLHQKPVPNQAITLAYGSNEYFFLQKFIDIAGISTKKQAVLGLKVLSDSICMGEMDNNLLEGKALCYKTAKSAFLREYTQGKSNGEGETLDLGPAPDPVDSLLELIANILD